MSAWASQCYPPLPPLPSSVSKIVLGTNAAKLSGNFLNFPVEDFTQQYTLYFDASCPPLIAAQPSISQKFWEQELMSGGAAILFCCHLRPTEQGAVGEPGTCLPQSAWLSQLWVRTASPSPEGQGWKEGKTGPERCLRSHPVQCSWSNSPSPNYESLTLCQPDSFLPSEKISGPLAWQNNQLVWVSSKLWGNRAVTWI